jgi:hypothetical protein
MCDNKEDKELHMSNGQSHTEEFRVSGEELLGRIKELIHAGNIRRVTIKNKDGQTIVEFPVTVGVVGALLAPSLAAVGAIAALVSEATVVVEKTED